MINLAPQNFVLLYLTYNYYMKYICIITIFITKLAAPLSVHILIKILLNFRKLQLRMWRKVWGQEIRVGVIGPAYPNQPLWPMLIDLNGAVMWICPIKRKGSMEDLINTWNRKILIRSTRLRPNVLSKFPLKAARWHFNLRIF